MPVYTNVTNDYKREFYLTNPTPQTKFTDDPFWSNVVTYITMDGSDGGTGFVDLSPLGLTVSRIGTSPPTTSTAQSKYGGSSGLFGASSSYLSVNNAALALGTGSFTIEAWAYKPTETNSNGLFSFGTSTTNFQNPTVATFGSTAPASTLRFVNIDSTFKLPLNQWNHIALVREGTGTNQTKGYVNGVLRLTTTLATNFTLTFINVGVYSASTSCWNGYIDSFRVTKGVARYTANFNPETDTFLAY